MTHIASGLTNVCFVATDTAGSDYAFERTVMLCEKSGAKLTIVQTLEPLPPGLLRLLESDDATANLVGEVRGEPADLDQLMDLARQRNVDATTHTLHGPAASEVLRYVLEEPPDLLVKAAEPSTAIRRWLFGYTDRQLLRRCPCPVWIENPAGQLSHGRILAAVDPTPCYDDLEDHSVRDELNASILYTAAYLASLEEAELHVVHTWQCFLEVSLKNRVGLPDHQVEKVLTAVQRQHEAALEDLLRPFDRQVSRVHLLKGNAAEEIVQLTSTGNFDVVVMGTICRTGIAGWLIGNTAETVLNHLDCSVVALKPSRLLAPVPD